MSASTMAAKCFVDNGRPTKDQRTTLRGQQDQGNKLATPQQDQGNKLAIPQSVLKGNNLIKVNRRTKDDVPIQIKGTKTRFIKSKTKEQTGYLITEGTATRPIKLINNKWYYLREVQGSFYTKESEALSKEQLRRHGLMQPTLKDKFTRTAKKAKTSYINSEARKELWKKALNKLPIEVATDAKKERIMRWHAAFAKLPYNQPEEIVN